MGQIKLLGAFLFLLIFGIAVVSYVFNFTYDNNSFTTLDDDFSAFNTNLRNNVTTYTTEVNTSSNNIITSTVSEGSQTTVTGQGIKVGIFTLFTVVNSVFALVRDKIFGGAGAPFVIILTVIGLYIYKTWIGANPD